tara:strand:- start:222 stop:422 length:201 start_codon:yes stop_codon:yes gene_type:complete
MKLPIRLDQFLKLMDIAQTGGHAKLIIQNGEVQVNGEVCTQRGKKLRKGDIVEFQSQKWVIPLQST